MQFKGVKDSCLQDKEFLEELRIMGGYTAMAVSISGKARSLLTTIYGEEYA